MPELSKTDPVLSNSNAMTWWTSTGCQTQPSSLSRNLSFKMVVPPKPLQHDNKLDFQGHDQNSASTHSSGQSYPEVACEGERKISKESISFKEQGCPVMQGMGMAEEGYTKSTLSSHDYTAPAPPSHFDYGQPIGPVPFTNFHPGLVAAYGTHTMVHPQMLRVMSNRIPLPLDLPQDEPMFVNAKQYHAILRRRQYRAKLEAQNKVSKDRKPYLHESRHRHALNRARGPGGRFLNVKKVQESNNTTSDDQYKSGFGLFPSTKNMWGAETHENGKYTEANPSPGSAGVYPQQKEFGFSVYASPDYGGSTHRGVGGFHGGTQNFLLVPQ